MKGWHIFLHSLKQVTGNLGGAIKVSAVPYLIQFVVTGAVFGFDGSAFDPANDPAKFAQGEFPGAGFWLSILLGLAIAFFTGCWIAVAWHRFVLLGEEGSTYLPILKSDRIWAYFVRSLGAFLVLLATGIILIIPAGILIAIAANLFGPVAPSLIGGLAPVLMVIPMFVILYRVSGSLPGAALGNEVGFWAGWNATKGENLNILLLVIFTFVTSLVVNGLSMIPTVGIVFQFLGGWLMIMVGASILTTLYGHYIEGRSLAGIQEQPNPFE